MKKRTFKTEVKLNLAEPKLNKNNTLREYTEQLLDENEYIVHFNGYVRAFWDMELLTNEEEEQILRSFMESVEIA